MEPLGMIYKMGKTHSSVKENNKQRSDPIFKNENLSFELACKLLAKLY